ncbi:hypothetical protein C8Q79DRAFT_971668 [Trametes meyenii]|nr:hypothetical protein C8Q79DRAFT_971668 [Trametes meyenii]
MVPLVTLVSWCVQCLCTNTMTLVGSTPPVHRERLLGEGNRHIPECELLHGRLRLWAFIETDVVAYSFVPSLPLPPVASIMLSGSRIRRYFAFSLIGSLPARSP